MALTAATDPTTSTSVKSTFGIASAYSRARSSPMDVFLVSRTTGRGGAGGGDPQATASDNAIRIVAMRRIELGLHCAMDGCTSRALVWCGASPANRIGPARA